MFIFGTLTVPPKFQTENRYCTEEVWDFVFFLPSQNRNDAVFATVIRDLFDSFALLKDRIPSFHCVHLFSYTRVGENNCTSVTKAVPWCMDHERTDLCVSWNATMLYSSMKCK